jgi:hypothetical protein
MLCNHQEKGDGDVRVHIFSIEIWGGQRTYDHVKEENEQTREVYIILM